MEIPGLKELRSHDDLNWSYTETVPNPDTPATFKFDQFSTHFFPPKE